MIASDWNEKNAFEKATSFSTVLETF